MYYRVAIQRQGDQLDRPPSWQWRSTLLSSLQTLFQFLRSMALFRKISCGCSPLPHGRAWRNSLRKRTGVTNPIRSRQLNFCERE